MSRGRIASATKHSLLESHTPNPADHLDDRPKPDLEQIVVGVTAVVSEAVVMQPIVLSIICMAVDDRCANASTLNAAGKADMVPVFNRTGGLSYNDPTMPLLADGASRRRPGLGDPRQSNPLHSPWV